jgi:hypothetical protein
LIFKSLNVNVKNKDSTVSETGGEDDDGVEVDQLEDRNLWQNEENQLQDEDAKAELIYLKGKKEKSEKKYYRIGEKGIDVNECVLLPFFSPGTEMLDLCCGTASAFNVWGGKQDGFYVGVDQDEECIAAASSRMLDHQLARRIVHPSLPKKLHYCTLHSRILECLPFRLTDASLATSSVWPSKSLPYLPLRLISPAISPPVFHDETHNTLINFRPPTLDNTTVTLSHDVPTTQKISKNSKNAHMEPEEEKTQKPSDDNNFPTSGIVEFSWDVPHQEVPNFPRGESLTCCFGCGCSFATPITLRSPSFKANEHFRTATERDEFLDGWGMCSAFCSETCCQLWNGSTQLQQQWLADPNNKVLSSHYNPNYLPPRAAFLLALRDEFTYQYNNQTISIVVPINGTVRAPTSNTERLFNIFEVDLCAHSMSEEQWKLRGPVPESLNDRMLDMECKWMGNRFQIGNSPIHGKGVFANEDWPKGTVVAYSLGKKFVGEISENGRGATNRRVEWAARDEPRRFVGDASHLHHEPMTSPQDTKTQEFHGVSRHWRCAVSSLDTTRKDDDVKKAAESIEGKDIYISIPDCSLFGRINSSGTYSRDLPVGVPGGAGTKRMTANAANKENSVHRNWRQFFLGSTAIRPGDEWPYLADPAGCYEIVLTKDVKKGEEILWNYINRHGEQEMDLGSSEAQDSQEGSGRLSDEEFDPQHPNNLC